MLGLAGRDLRPGALLPLNEADTNELSQRVREVGMAAQATNRPVLVEHQEERGTSVEIFHNPMADGGYVLTLLDVTERRQVEEALRQAQKLESMGQMTGGVAHDFNNLLTVIIGSLGLLRRTIGRDDKASERIDMISIAAERAARLTRQLLAFARRQPLQPEIVNLDHVMQETLPLVRRAVGESITVECITAGGLWNTTVDTSEFQSAGTGLGLPHVYGFVKQLGGHLKIYSEVGEGTTVKLYLPRSFGEKIIQPAPVTVLAVTGTETVLVVDDDQIVRATVASMLDHRP